MDENTKKLVSGIDPAFIEQYPQMAQIVLATRMFLDRTPEGTDTRFLIQEDPDGYERAPSLYNSMEATSLLLSCLREEFGDKAGFWSTTLSDMSVSAKEIEPETSTIEYNGILLGFPDGVPQSIQDLMNDESRLPRYLLPGEEARAIDLFLEATAEDDSSVEGLWLIDITADQVGLPRIVIKPWKAADISSEILLVTEDSNYSISLALNDEAADAINESTLGAWKKEWLEFGSSYKLAASSLLSEIKAATLSLNTKF